MSNKCEKCGSDECDWTDPQGCLERQLAQARKERDLAIAHDLQPYPTVEAYETVCRARTKWQERAEKAEAEVERLREGFNAAVRKPMGVVPAGYEDLYDAKERAMSDANSQAAQVPLLELLRDVPEDACLDLEVQHNHWRHIPVGRYCRAAAHQLAQAVERLRTARTQEAYGAVCDERDEWRKRAEKAEAEVERLREGFNAAVRKPMGVVPAGYEDLYDAKERAMSGAELIAQERERQLTVEKWSAAHDDEHENGQLARAAACYSLYDVRWAGRGIRAQLKKRIWPSTWSPHWWKPKDRVSNLVRAGALIAAEIDRVLRFEAKGEGR